MQVDPSIFKAYDVRGIVPDQLDSSLAHDVGAAFVRVLDAKVKKEQPAAPAA